MRGQLRCLLWPEIQAGQQTCPSSSWKSQDHRHFQKLGGRGLEWGVLQRGRCVCLCGEGAMDGTVGWLCV